MPVHVVIDGNNLLYAMRAHAPIPSVGRETMVRVVERWARQGNDDVTLVFDGAPPTGGLSKQMSSSRINVRFSAPRTADDVIVGIIQQAPLPVEVRVVTGDTAIQREARLRKCQSTDAVGFVCELFPSDNEPQRSGPTPSEKPHEVTDDEAREWLDLFGIDDDEPFDGHDAMTQ